ncbi:hypothetical protein BU25DRAFT_421917 [Macroventuria anomochaeta]|uniref:Uncharacterized protein n=1 Tax=Macroventuria anomochaeta TaxID=301207 RepID=A0ACB6S0T1_9PLEO|nr:uncharacterized protein BU25DRAFT_421917 [Macroventuria anomochaeta]KAF2626999.1 hypothetical protein BU25DRAFT_421917 [Macroventuria anomochaeta]
MAALNNEFLYSTGCPLTTFHPFPKLPANLRALISNLAAPAPRTRFVELYGYSAPTYTPKIRYIPRLPPLFHTSRETRNFSITHEGGTLVHFFATEKEDKKFYVNFSQDIIFLSSRFTPSGKSTETSRLRKLSSLLKPSFLSRVCKIVVTYSSLDDYAAVGKVLLDYVGLETLYVAMCDWWSERSVKMRLRRGRPIVGYVMWKIEAEMRIAEGEETEDEEESREEIEERMEIRRKRRVLECELRLDEPENRV